MQVNGQHADPGCYIEGSWGQYGIDRLADVAEQFGLKVLGVNDPRVWRIEAESGDAPDWAWTGHVDAGDKLENMLNDATTGGYWIWEDGEFYLVLTEVDRWLFVTDTDYDAAWEQVVNANVNEHAGYTDQYQACELAEDGDEDDKVFQFRITVQYEPFNHEGQEVTNGNDD